MVILSCVLEIHHVNGNTGFKFANQNLLRNLLKESTSLSGTSKFLMDL